MKLKDKHENYVHAPAYRIAVEQIISKINDYAVYNIKSNFGTFALIFPEEGIVTLLPAETDEEVFCNIK